MNERNCGYRSCAFSPAPIIPMTKEQWIKERIQVLRKSIQSHLDIGHNVPNNILSEFLELTK